MPQAVKMPVMQLSPAASGWVAAAASGRRDEQQGEEGDEQETPHGAEPYFTLVGRTTTRESSPRLKPEPADFLRSVIGQFDGPGWTRTSDLGIKSPLLYQLSYRPRGRV